MTDLCGLLVAPALFEMLTTPFPALFATLTTPFPALFATLTTPFVFATLTTLLHAGRLGLSG